ncbi:1-acyl-sn-glycerol-3-phosphate acyltransferase [Patescibacteria group bacterium]|nr:1-acyl-sn-glycerol-3-phosphate acyltransferase [Patescibacteria group bacterium]MBU0964493.1 1-acyl-sn-glycerol-3-phosphate acyltransferase [Patescibacteria group bacterium]
MPYQVVRPIFEPLIKKKFRQVSGKENLPTKPPFILAANHIGYLDPIALVILILQLYNLPTYYLTIHYMWWIWGGPLATHWLAMIHVKYGHRKDSLKAAINNINNGNIVGIFPEGTRNPDSRSLLRGKTGAVRLALATGAPLIPVGFKNNTGHRIGKAFRSLWQSDKYIDITFGQALDLSEFANKEIDKLLLKAATHKLMLAISQLCGKKYPFEIEN